MPEHEVDERKARILRAIVSHYVSTGEPVGSKTLVDRYRLRVSPATVRNDMASLEDAGYIYHPHTSAGRVPTDAGYRFFVDEFSDDSRLPSRDARLVEQFFGEPRFELQDALRQTAALLSSLTNHAAVVFAPALDRSLIRHVDLVRLSGGRAMLVVVTDTGRVENHILTIPEDLDEVQLENASEMLNRALVDTPLERASAATTAAVERFPLELRPAVIAVAHALKQQTTDRDTEQVFLEGTATIVDEGKFADLSTVRQVIEALEHRRLLLEVLADALDGAQVSVRIGAENPIADLQHCSVIAAPYGPPGTALGSLGIVGPTRMDYRRTIAAVYEVSAQLGRMLTELGME
ncbi:MAG: heat-inducible transcriptional repressor HrcA [Actinomycetota bacterium]|nr:heat-inducible transcriptional repressor HrcA [Actinomycetota bacterium]